MSRETQAEFQALMEVHAETHGRGLEALASTVAPESRALFQQAIWMTNLVAADLAGDLGRAEVLRLFESNALETGNPVPPVVRKLLPTIAARLGAMWRAFEWVCREEMGLVPDLVMLAGHQPRILEGLALLEDTMASFPATPEQASFYRDLYLLTWRGQDHPSVF